MARDVTGTVLQTRATTTSSYVSVAEVLEITAGDLTRERIDVTHLGTTAATRAYIGSFIELGELSGSVNLNIAEVTHSGSSNGLAGRFVSGTTDGWRILPEGNTSQANTFDGYLSAFTPRYNVGDQQIADFAIQLTTLPVFTT